MNQDRPHTQTIEVFGYRCRVGRRADDLPTIKQAHVMAGIAAGLTQKEIAKLRGVSPATVKSASETLYAWLQAQRAADAVAKAISRGWIAPLALALMLADLHGISMRHRPPTRTRQQVTASYRTARRDLEVLA